MVMKYNYELEMKILEEIYYIISQHMNSGKKNDIDFLDSIFNIIKNYKQLDKYVNKIIIDNSINDLAYYSIIHKSISFNLNKIYKHIEIENQTFSKGER